MEKYGSGTINGKCGATNPTNNAQGLFSRSPDCKYSIDLFSIKLSASIIAVVPGPASFTSGQGFGAFGIPSSHRNMGCLPAESRFSADRSFSGASPWGS